jgi:hypothetical protein
MYVDEGCKTGDIISRFVAGSTAKMEASVTGFYLENFAFLDDILDFHTQVKIKGGHNKDLLRSGLVWFYLQIRNPYSVTYKRMATAADYIIHLGFTLIKR